MPRLLFIYNLKNLIDFMSDHSLKSRKNSASEGAKSEINVKPFTLSSKEDLDK